MSDDTRAPHWLYPTDDHVCSHCFCRPYVPIGFTHYTSTFSSAQMMCCKCDKRVPGSPRRILL